MPDAVEPRIAYLRFGGTAEPEHGTVTIDEAVALKAEDAADRVLWIDVQGLGDGSVATQLGEAFGVHALAASDIVNLGQRPKVEEYPDEENTLIVLRMVAMHEGRLTWEQVSCVGGAGYLLTFQERHGDCLDPLRDRIFRKRKNLMSRGAGYLTVQVIDAIVDGYFPVLEEFGDQLEHLEDEILRRPHRSQLARVYELRGEILTFRRAVWPLRDALGRLMREGGTFGGAVDLYLRDVADHVHQVVDVLETYREIAGSLVEVYLSMLGHRTNEVMKVLTVIASIFIPLTFVAGIYGMNFDTGLPGNLPELGLPYGYVGFLVFCFLTACGLLVLFRRLGWLGGDEAS